MKSPKRSMLDLDIISELLITVTEVRGCYLTGGDEEDASEITKQSRISPLSFRREVMRDDRKGGEMRGR